MGKTRKFNYNNYHRKYILKRMYGLTIPEYDQKVLECGGVCEICLRPETAKRNGVVRRLCVDHDHATKRVRGILCASCNRAIGYLGDDPLRADALAKYLRERQ